METMKRCAQLPTGLSVSPPPLDGFGKLSDF
jgi:hypothetical protein